MTYPDAAGSTWKVTASDNGILRTESGDYRYLFWEGQPLTENWSFNKGFCVKGSETISFLEDELEKLGLNSQEKEDFITYWGPQMINNRYNVISFQTKNYTDMAKLTVNPVPDKTFRVFMAWYPSDTLVKLEAQSFKIPGRKGKVLVEWGGVKVDTEDSQEETTTSSSATDSGSKTDTQDKKETSTEESSSAPTTSAITETVSADPYAQYGSQAQCAKDWDATAAKKCGQTWAQLDAGTRSAAYNHWIGHGTDGW